MADDIELSEDEENRAREVRALLGLAEHFDRMRSFRAQPQAPAEGALVLSEPVAIASDVQSNLEALEERVARED